MNQVKLSEGRLLDFQKQQFAHDRRNHSDILSLHKTDRLKHYGLHYCKYVGRLSRGVDEEKSVLQTVVDTFLVCLSAANTLHQNLSELPLQPATDSTQRDRFMWYADAAGRFADACEKIDHMEDFGTMAKIANKDICEWSIHAFDYMDSNIEDELASRRQTLAKRHFYI